MENFWQAQKPGFLAMAPMAGVSDSAFRQMCKKYGCDVTYSEMASSTALFYDAKNKKGLEHSETLKLLEFSPTEKPYVVQLFGSKPEHFALAAKIVTKRVRPDGIDINFGCPVNKIQKQGAGAVLMEDMQTARAVIEAVIGNTDLPVSIKTRTKVGHTDVIEFLDYVADLDIKALMIHGRTLAQMFGGAIDTLIIKEARRHFKGTIIANGGINDFNEAKRVLDETRADGLGIARGAMGRPWIFEEIKKGQSELMPKEKIFQTALAHALLAEEFKGRAGIIEMRKHLCWYVQGLPGARRMRERLVKIEEIKEIEKIFNEYN